MAWQFYPGTVILAKLGEALNESQPLLARQHKNNAISDWQRWRDVVLATYECA